jgi:hypothetical protein
VSRSVVLAAVLAAPVVAAVAAAADPTDPNVKLSEADQRVAAASVLRFSDLGAAWSGGPTKHQNLKIPVGPANQPNNSDLVITGHAESLLALESQGLQVDSDVLVLKSAAQAKKLLGRMMKPTLGQCLAYDLQKSGVLGTSYTLGVIKQLPAPKVGDNATIVRIPVTVKSGGHKVAVFADYIFVTRGRTQFFVNLITPSNLGSALTNLESHIARTLASRGR